MFRSYDVEISKDNNMTIDDLFELANNLEENITFNNSRARENTLNVILLKILYDRINNMTEEDDIIPIAPLKNRLFGRYMESNRERNRLGEHRFSSFTEYIYYNQQEIDDMITEFRERM